MNRIKFIMTATALALVFTSGFIGAVNAADNHCTNLTQESCTPEVACKWKAEENWTRAEDGKTRKVKAKCLFDAKSAKAMIEAKFNQPTE